MSDLKQVAHQALEALESTQLFAAHEHYPRRRVADTLDALRAALEQPVQTCNCRWVGDVQTQQCTLHEAHVDAIHEWAERAKAAEAKLAALELEQQEQEPVAWLRREELADLQGCNYRQLGADSPRIWAPREADTPTPEQDLVPVYTAPPRREWQFLSAEERYRIADESASTIVAVLATEAALRSKNYE
jgi:hypothetical protein